MDRSIGVKCERGFPGHWWGSLSESVGLLGKSVGMREEYQGQCLRVYPSAQGGSRTRCGEKQERVHSVQAEGNLRRV